MIKKKTIIALLAFGLALLPLSKVFAAAYVTLNYFSGQPTILQVSGGGWNNGETVSIYLGNVSGNAVATATAGSNSLFGPVSVAIPTNTLQGALPVIAVGSSGETETNSYYVVPFSPSITPAVSPNTPGSSAAVTGQGFAPREDVYFSINGQSSGQATTDNAGSFTNGTLVVPNLAPGTYVLHATGALSGADAIYYFYIGGFFPSASPSVYYLLPGASLSFSGSGFKAGESINVTQGSDATVLSTITADASGSFSNAGSFTVPLSMAGGVRTFHLTGNAGNTAPDVMVTVGTFNGMVSPSSYYVNAGDSLTFSGSGFAPGETVDVFVGNSGTPVSSFGVATDGSFNGAGAVAVPFSFTGTVQAFSLKGLSSGTTASVQITVAGLYPSVTPSSWYVVPGSGLSFSGSGFEPGESVNIANGKTAVGSALADSNGNFASATSTVPFVSGAQTYTFTGASSGVSTTVSLTVAAVTPYASADSYYAAPGTTVNVFGHNFAAGENVIAKVGTDTVNSTADGSGNTPAIPVVIPFGIKGPVMVILTGTSSGASATVPITLAPFSPQIVPSSWYVSPGATVDFSGTGFAPGETLSVMLNNNSAASATVSASGTITNLPVQIPYTASTANFVFSGSLSQTSVSINVSVAQLAPSIWLSSYYNQGGNPLIVFGSGFAGGENVNVSFNGTSLGNIAADSGGNFTLVSAVPFGAAGNKTVQARGQQSGASASANFTQPQVYVNAQLGSYAGAPGGAVTFIGSGYLPNEPIQITTDRTGSSAVYSFNADSSGSFNNSGYSIPTTFSGGPLTVTITGTHSFTSTSITYYVTGP